MINKVKCTIHYHLLHNTLLDYLRDRLESRDRAGTTLLLFILILRQLLRAQMLICGKVRFDMVANRFTSSGSDSLNASDSAWSCDSHCPR